MSENLKNKFNRVAADPSQLQEFVDGLLGGEIPAKKAEQTASGVDIDQAISSIVGFDGEVEYTDGPSSYIAPANLPTSPGIYKIVNSEKICSGYMVYYPVPTNLFWCIGSFRAVMFRVSTGDARTSNNLVFNNHTLPLGTKLYRHTINITLNYTYDGTTRTPNLNLDFISTVSSALNEEYFKQLVYYNAFYKFAKNITKPGDMWMYVDTGNRLDPANPASLVLSKPATNFFTNDKFNTVGGITFTSSYPSGSLSIAIYGPDKIDITTGEMVTRTNLASDTSVTFVSDTVTPL